MIIMEHKIGEIFEHNGEWYQCVIDTNCHECDFSSNNITCDMHGELLCTCKERSDGTSVVFKKLEKVGEPYEYDGYIFQEYHVFEEQIFTENYATIREFGVNSKISIEIKQTKEDMEEKKFNLKPFDLQKAKAGKPVCTRDGRKARIICFDRRLFYKNVSYPILTLVERSDGEDDVCGYNEKGKVLIEDGAEYKDDLMMLPEKKEGWVNVYKERCYETREEAIRHIAPGTKYVDTIRVEWEE